MEIMLKNKCCLYVIISIRFFSITVCNLLIESPSCIKNKRAPKIEPCGTPYEIALAEDWNLCWVYVLLPVWDISTNCVLFVKQDWNHLFTEPLIPYESSMSSNLLWLIASYALERSRKMPTACRCLSRASWTLCINGD